MINLYYSFVYPYLLYCVLLWGDATQNYLISIITVQKKIIRIITSSSYLAYTSSLFHDTKILKIKDVYKYQLGITMFKLSSKNSLDRPTHTYSTRGRLDAVPRFQRLGQCQRSVFYNGPKLFNIIPTENPQ